MRSNAGIMRMGDGGSRRPFNRTLPRPLATQLATLQSRALFLGARRAVAPDAGA